MMRLQRWLKPSPEKARNAFIGVFFASLITGTLANLKALVPYRPAPAPSPAASPAPQAPPVVVPTPAPRIYTRIEPYPRSLGAAAPSPRRYEYSVQTTLWDAGKVIPLPATTGTADAVLGPLIVKVPAGETIEWDPRVSGGDVQVRLIFAASDVAATDSDHLVQIWPGGGVAPTPPGIHALDPVAIIPEDFDLPVGLRNTTDRDAKVTIRMYLNTDSIVDL